MAFPHRALFEIAADRDLGPVSDHDRLIASAREHRLLGSLWTRVQHDPSWRPWRRELALLDLAAEERQCRLWRTLEATVDRLGAIGVEVATFKGVTSEARWYNRRGERASIDVDLLLSPADWGRAEEIVALLHPGHVLAGHIDELVRKGLLQSVDVGVEGMAVDLHFDLLKLGAPSRQHALMFQRTVPYPLPGGGTVRVLDAEMALVHFLVHLNKDRFRRLSAYADIARVLAKEDIDWAFVERFAAAEGLRTPVVLALEVVTDTLGLQRAPLPTPTGWRAAAWSALWHPSVRLRGDLGDVQLRHRQDLISILAPGRTPTALWFWLRNRLFPARPFLAQWYPEIPPRPYLVRLVQGRTEKVWSRQVARMRRVAGALGRGRRERARERV